MNPIGDKEKVTIRAVSRDQGKKLIDKRIKRLDRHLVHGRTGITQPLPKSGRGRKFT